MIVHKDAKLPSKFSFSSDSETYVDILCTIPIFQWGLASRNILRKRITNVHWESVIDP